MLLLLCSWGNETNEYPALDESVLYNKLSYARILIGSHLWSIGGGVQNNLNHCWFQLIADRAKPEADG